MSDAIWDEYKGLVIKFGEQLGDLLRDDQSLVDWRNQFESIKFGADFADIVALSDRLIGCTHPRVKEWCHWATNNSWPFLVYTAWYRLTQQQVQP